MILVAESSAVVSVSDPIKDQPYSLFPMIGNTQLAPTPMSIHRILNPVGIFPLLLDANRSATK